MSITKERVAQVAHEVVRAYCESIGEYLPAWGDAPEWMKASALNGVEFHWTADHSVSASHENWMQMKFAEGWVYGPVKDPVAKTHPCLVPFSKLPNEQKVKDYLFRATVHTLRSSPAQPPPPQVVGVDGIKSTTAWGPI